MNEVESTKRSIRQKAQRRGSLPTLLLCSLIIVAGVVSFCWRGSDTVSEGPRPAQSSSATIKPAISKFAVSIRRPAGPPTVDTGIKDASGKSVTVSCATCHATRQPNFENKSVADLNEFHNALPFSHGTISCLSCHNSTDYDALKLADNSRVEFSDVMTLCAQCHGPQMRDYEHGAHGGMNGHWDLSRGPREKNNCIDCHNPHTPQFPKMQPTFKPKDRFLEKLEH